MNEMKAHEKICEFKSRGKRLELIESEDVNDDQSNIVTTEKPVE